MSFHWFLRSWNHKQMNDSLSKLDLSGPSSDNSNSTAELEHELLSRCFWSLLIMDRIVATAENRSPFMTLDNVKPLPRYPNFDNDIPAEYKNNPLVLSHFHPKMLFRMLVRISLLVSKVEEWSRKSFMKAKGLNTRENDPVDVALDLGLQNSTLNSMNGDSPTGSEIPQEQVSLLLDFHAFAESFKPPQRLELPVSLDSKELALQIPDIRSPFINTMFLSTNWIFRIIQIFLETDISKKWEAIKIILCTVPKTFSPFSSYILRITASAALELITDTSASGESQIMGVPTVEDVMCWLTDALEHLDSGFWAVPEDINFIRNVIRSLQNYRQC
ncbi:hypothetical protein BKA69DRAFT_1100198 [Paraphysoderma sedebokerense]|nr:hypothetical protein BKA69DRAFT_1100198 [Paraphysoderma sedebokerense]